MVRSLQKKCHNLVSLVRSNGLDVRSWNKRATSRRRLVYERERLMSNLR